MKIAMMHALSFAILPLLTAASDAGNSLIQTRTVRQRATITLEDESHEPHITIKGVPFYLNDTPRKEVTALQMKEKKGLQVVFKDVPAEQCQDLQDNMDQFVKCVEEHGCTIELEGHVCEGGLSIVETTCSMDDITPCLSDMVELVAEDAEIHLDPETSTSTSQAVWGIDRVDQEKGR